MTALDTTFANLYLAQYALNDNDCEVVSEGTPNYWLATDSQTNQRLKLDLGCKTKFTTIVLKNTINSGLNDRLTKTSYFYFFYLT